MAPARGNAAAAGSSAGQQRAAAAAVTPPPAKPKPPPLQQQSAASKPPQQQQQQQPSFWQAQDGSGGAVYISESARVTHAGGRYETADGDGGMAVADNARVAASSGSTANAAGPRHDGNGSGGTQVGDAGLANAAHAVYTAGGWLQVPAAQQQVSRVAGHNQRPACHASRLGRRPSNTATLPLTPRSRARP